MSSVFKKRLPELPIEDDVAIWIEGEHFGKCGQWFALEMFTVINGKQSGEGPERNETFLRCENACTLTRWTVVIKSASVVDWGVDRTLLSGC